MHDSKPVASLPHPKVADLEYVGISSGKQAVARREVTMNAELRVKVRHAKCGVQTHLHFLSHLQDHERCNAKRTRSSCDYTEEIVPLDKVKMQGNKVQSAAQQGRRRQI
jgi:hypothetical protein